MRTLQIDPNTKKPFRSAIKLWKDLEYLINTGKHREPTKIRWITRNRTQA